MESNKSFISHYHKRMKDCGIKQQEVCKVTKWSASKLSQMLNFNVEPQKGDVEKLGKAVQKIIDTRRKHFEST